MIHPNYVIWCLAGNYRQSEWHRVEFGYSNEEWRYLNDPQCLYGLQRPQFVRVGTWDQRDPRFLYEIMMMLQSCRALEATQRQLQEEKAWERLRVEDWQLRVLRLNGL